MKCKLCGMDLDDSMKYCSYCGELLQPVTGDAGCSEADAGKKSRSAEKKSTKRRYLYEISDFFKKARYKGIKLRRDSDGRIAIGGWLYLVGIHILLKVIATGMGALEAFGGLFEMKKSPELSELFSGLMRFEFLGFAFLLVFSLVALTLFMMKKRIFKKVYLANMACFVLFHALDYLLIANSSAWEHIGAEQRAMLWKSILGALVSLVVWAAYLKRSLRAKITFTH